jgi:hypothetical protein
MEISIPPLSGTFAPIWNGRRLTKVQYRIAQGIAPPGPRGLWELTVLNVQMKGKALFFKTISVQQKMLRSGFRRVSDDLTLAQAADILGEPPLVRLP